MPTVYRTVPGSALYFPLLRGLQSILRTATGSQAPTASLHTQNLVAGALARATAGAIMSPITLVKARFEVA